MKIDGGIEGVTNKVSSGIKEQEGGGKKKKLNSEKDEREEQREFANEAILCSGL